MQSASEQSEQSVYIHHIPWCFGHILTPGTSNEASVQCDFCNKHTCTCTYESSHPVLTAVLHTVQDTVIEEDKDFVTQYFDMPDTDFADMERMSPWLLRIELNREMLTDKGLNMSRIADTITSEFGDEMSVIFTDDNAPKHILRVSQRMIAASTTVTCTIRNTM